MTFMYDISILGGPAVIQYYDPFPTYPAFMR